jgi:hypothetical protein
VSDGKIDGLRVRPAVSTLESLQDLELHGARLRDVATFEASGAPERCTIEGASILVSVRTSPGTGELKLPSHPAVKLTPFTPARVATFLQPAGTEDGLEALARAYAGAVITEEDGQLVVMMPSDSAMNEVPGLALRSVDDRHSVVNVNGPDFELLTEIAGKLRAALEKEHPRWLGTAWPNLAPERVITPGPGMKDVPETLRLALTGAEAGELSDGTVIRVRAGTSLDDAVLPDGRPLKDAVQFTATMEPVALLRVNRQRAVELEVGLEPEDVMRAVQTLQLPAGVSITVH